jgi:hypothetical protein
MTAVKPETPLFDRARLDALPVEHLCDLSIDLEPAQVIPTSLGTRMTFIAKGGRLHGPRLRGELLPGGGDWATLGSDGVNRLDIRGTIRTDDGVLIHYEGRGVVNIPADGRKRLASGARLSFDESYVRTTPRFETADPRYAWLNGLVIVGYNELSHDHIDYRMYQVL